jgi:hypothetical protein
LSNVSVRRLAWFAIFGAALLHAQDEGIGWDPKIRDGPIPTWQEILGLLVIALAVYAHWRFAKWFIARRRDKPNWRIVRYWWPTSIVALDGLLVLLVNAGRPEGWVDILGIAVVLANIPTLPAVYPLVFLVDGFHLGDRSATSVAAPVLWLAWYGIIRFLEWRSFCGAPLSIGSRTTYSPLPQS